MHAQCVHDSVGFITHITAPQAQYTVFFGAYCTPAVVGDLFAWWVGWGPAGLGDWVAGRGKGGGAGIQAECTLLRQHAFVSCTYVLCTAVHVM
jgi:hypothetical protein